MTTGEDTSDDEPEQISLEEVTAGNDKSTETSPASTNEEEDEFVDEDDDEGADEPAPEEAKQSS